LRDKSQGKEDRKMSAEYISTAKGMADFLLTREHRGPGDTIEAAAYRLQTKFGVPVTVLMRLRHREVKDMLMSNFMALAGAYSKVSQKIEDAYEREREVAIDPKILRLADFVAGKKVEG
jgi:nitrogenase molybdenum-iron protein alpha/beta subunit